MNDGGFKGSNAWEVYRRLRWQYWTAYLGGFVLACVLTLLVMRVAPQSLKVVFPALAILWMAACVVTGCRAARFRCPRCGKRFFTNGWGSNSYAKKCTHCGLPKWDEM